jgi:DNA primase
MANVFDAVKSLSIKDVVERFSSVSLKQTGSNWSGLCPFHKEKTPSFSLSTAKNVFHCFGCDTGGDAVNFVAKIKCYESNRVAAVEIARSFGLEIDETKFVKDNSQKQAIYICNKAAQEKYTESLLGLSGELGRMVKGYLKGRLNLTDRQKIVDVINEWGIGWCSNQIEVSWDKNIAQLAGLYNESKGNQTFYNRIVVPIRDGRGQVCGFGGRILPDYATDYTPKYLNSKENEVFHKQDLLFGLSESLAKTNSKSIWILTESYFDVVNMHARGIRSAVAIMGTAVSEKQVDLLVQTRKVNGVLILAHNDKNFAGMKSAIASYELIAARGIKVNICRPMGDFKDVSDIFESQPDMTWVDATANITNRSYLQALEEIGVDDESERIERALRLAKKIQSPLCQDDFLIHLSAELGRSKQLLKNQMSYL